MDKKVLFAKAKSGKKQFWEVWTEGEELHLRFGQIEGKAQHKIEKVCGKNIGRSNETSPSEQAVLEAISRWKKQFDKGYRETIEELDEFVPAVMLAVDFKKQGHRIKFPCYGSPKLDGVRCLAIKKDGSVTLRSRGGKDYYVGHIIHSLVDVMQDGEIWDGELYIHGLYLEEIVSAVKKPNANTSLLKYYVFDIPSDKPYSKRSEEMVVLNDELNPNSSIEVLQDFIIEDEAALHEMHDECVRDGYEGLMIRSVDGLYEWGKRSADLQKFKQMIDEEFKCVAVEEDRNQNAVLVLYDETAKANFTCCFGTFEERKRQLSHPSDYIGRYLTVAFQTRYLESRLPQFPCGKAWRCVDENGKPLE